MPKPSRTSRELRAQLHLLVVEDNKVNQEVALGILENLGYRADVAGDGYSALRALAEKDYDLILVDCQLPRWMGTRPRGEFVSSIPPFATMLYRLSPPRPTPCLAIARSV